MKISIIVPVYNAEKTIEYCIDSIITQKTKFEIELILVEDYSTDRSYEICLALKKKYTEIKLYRTNGKGVSAARNTGLSHSTGDVVGFCDSDDIYEKDVFEKVRLFFENKDIDIVIGGFYYSKKDSLNTVVQETHSHNRQRNVEGHLLYNMILNDGRILGSVCNKFYRAESIRDFSFLILYPSILYRQSVSQPISLYTSSEKGLQVIFRLLRLSGLRCTSAGHPCHFHHNRVQQCASNHC